MMNNERITCNCDQCGCAINNNFYTVELDMLCEDCYSMYGIECDRCNRNVYTENGEWIEGDFLCETCLDEVNFFCCTECGDRFYERHNFGNTYTPLCRHCYEQSYYRCECCNCLLHADDAYFHDGMPYCESCFEDIQEDEVIHDYYYKPDPMFRGVATDDRYFGVELEISGSGEDNDNARELLNILNDYENEHAYAKHDGSVLSGFEVVSQPMTLKYHLNCVNWEKFMNAAVEMGYRSHQTTCCGLHVHVSRDAFGYDREYQDGCIAKLLYFVEIHWAELVKFSRRRQSEIDEWARPWGVEETPQKLLDKCKSRYDSRRRYHNINLQNDHTVEFRFFHGTLRYKTFVATLQMVNHLVELATNYSTEVIQSLSWLDFVGMISEPELIEYLRERKLYVNDDVNESEDF